MTTSSNKGFTLVELMIVVVVVAILAAIAYPSYTKQIQKSRRHKAESCLMEYAQFMERYYTTNMTYAGASLPSSCSSELGGYYAFAFDGTPNSISYAIKATATGAQSSDKASNTSCSPLKIDHTGNKSPSGCWQ